MNFYNKTTLSEMSLNVKLLFAVRNGLNELLDSRLLLSQRQNIDLGLPDYDMVR